MMKKYLGLGLLFFLGLWSAGFSQLQISPDKYWEAKPEINFQAQSVAPLAVRSQSTSTLSPSQELIRPRFVRENPRGFSYLCRLELKIEDKLPIGVWLNLGEWSNLPGNSGGNAHLKFKLLNF